MSSTEYLTRTKSSTVGELYLNIEMSDIVFIFKENDRECARLPAHKTILANASTVFRAMFSGSWKEQAQVEIIDATVDAFKEFLQFIYLGKVKLTIVNIMEVFNLGNKYNIPDCLDICGEFLISNVSASNVLLYYEVAVLYEHKGLQSKCETFCGKNINEVFDSKGFRNWDFKTVDRILRKVFLGDRVSHQLASGGK